MKKNRRTAALLMAGILAAGAVSGSAVHAEAETPDISGTTLNLYTWDGMFPQEVLDGFTEKYGVKIQYSNFDYNEDMLAKLEENGASDYDVVVADDYILQMVNEEGLSEELDKSKIPNYDNQNENFMGLFYDPDNKYDVLYGVGIPLIVYDPSVIDMEITSYEDLWDESLEDNVGIIANYRVIDGITLKTLGESFNTEDIGTIEKAGEKLAELAPNIRAINDNNTQDLILSGEVGVAFMYTSQVTNALRADPELKTVYPEEGLGIGAMAQFIPKNAPNKEAAYAFINYILDPEVSAKCFDSEEFGYYCTNKAAEELISEENRQYVVLPDDVTWDTGEAIRPVSDEANEAHMKIWAEFQSACGM